VALEARGFVVLVEELTVMSTVPPSTQFIVAEPFGPMPLLGIPWLARPACWESKVKAAIAASSVSIVLGSLPQPVAATSAKLPNQPSVRFIGSLLKATPYQQMASEIERPGHFRPVVAG